MQIGDIITDLHGNQYKILDFQVIGFEYPLFHDNREAILTSSYEFPINLIIRGNDQMITYNEHHKIYFQYSLEFIKYIQNKAITNENTKVNGINGSSGRLSQIGRDPKRRKV